MGYRFGIQYIDKVIYHVDMVVLDIDTGIGLMIWEMKIAIWDILSLCLGQRRRVGSGYRRSGSLEALRLVPAATTTAAVAAAAPNTTPPPPTFT